MKNKNNLILAAIVIVLAAILLWPTKKDELNAPTDESALTSDEEATGLTDGDEETAMTDESDDMAADDGIIATPEIVITPSGGTGAGAAGFGSSASVTANDTPVVSTGGVGSMAVKVFFNQHPPTGQNLDCDKVMAVTRFIPRTSAVGRAALNQLLAGPTAAEKQAGYFSSLNSGAVINSLTINGGMARADFSARLNDNVAGSCLVTAIRAQITETLKQFPSVSSVTITVNGRTDVLQP